MSDELPVVYGPPPKNVENLTDDANAPEEKDAVRVVDNQA